MRTSRLTALSFIDETNKIASALQIPVNQIAIKQAAELIEDFYEKTAATRSVKEWRRAQGAGDGATADAIAKGYGDLGLKPRHLDDISEGGGEAGVDRMMGRVSNPTTGAVNESGYLARKLYKPDSTVTRGEYTGKLLEQKQRMTDTARAMSPEAKNMVPDMYGHRTMNAANPEMARNVSFHEYVPNMTDIRGRNVGSDANPVWDSGGKNHVGDIERTLVRPLQEKGMQMKDVLRQAGGTQANYGNMAMTPSGPKVVDFLPEFKGEKKPHLQSFAKYSPEVSEMQFNQKGALPFLRREVFNPQMKVQPAHPAVQNAARSLIGDQSGITAPTPPAQSAAQQQVTAPGRQIQKPIQPSQRHATPPGAVAAYSDPFPAQHGPTAPGTAAQQQVTAPGKKPPMSAPVSGTAPTVRPPAVAASMSMPTVRPPAAMAAAQKMKLPAAPRLPHL